MALHISGIYGALKDRVSQYGEVMRYDLKTRPTCTFEHYAFETFISNEEAKACIDEMNGTKWEGYALKVSWTREHAENLRKEGKFHLLPSVSSRPRLPRQTRPPPYHHPAAPPPHPPHPASDGYYPMPNPYYQQQQIHHHQPNDGGIFRYRQQITKLEEDLNVTRQQLKEEQQSCIGKNNEILEYKSNLKYAHDQNDQKDDRIRELEKRIRDLEAVRSVHMNEFSEKDRDLSEKEGEIKQLISDLATGVDKNENLTQQVKTLMEENQKLRNNSTKVILLSRPPPPPLITNRSTRMIDRYIQTKPMEISHNKKEDSNESVDTLWRTMQRTIHEKDETIKIYENYIIENFSKNQQTNEKKNMEQEEEEELVRKAQTMQGGRGKKRRRDEIDLELQQPQKKRKLDHGEEKKEEEI